MLGMPWSKSVISFGKAFTRPDVPSSRIALGWMTQAVDRQALQIEISGDSDFQPFVALQKVCVEPFADALLEVSETYRAAATSPQLTYSFEKCKHVPNARTGSMQTLTCLEQNRNNVNKTYLSLVVHLLDGAMCFIGKGSKSLLMPIFNHSSLGKKSAPKCRQKRFCRSIRVIARLPKSLQLRKLCWRA